MVRRDKQMVTVLKHRFPSTLREGDQMTVHVTLCDHRKATLLNCTVNDIDETRGTILVIAD